MTASSVTCLMVTRPTPQREVAIRQSIDDYCAQTWTHKNLLVLVNGPAAAEEAKLLSYIASLARTDIEVHSAPADLPLGGLRNLSVAAASGSLICQWDDDDRHHPLRLERQIGALEAGGFEALYLQDVMQYFPRLKAMWWTNWRATSCRGHPATLLARRADLPAYSDDLQRGEDLAVAKLLTARGRCGLLADEPHLYLYVSHGSNTCPDAHHVMLVERLAISQGLLRRRERAVRDGLLPFGLGGEGLKVRGGNGPAFGL